jgi:hypothetical protein
MKAIALFSAATILFKSAFCQVNFQPYNAARIKMTENAMLVLGSWGGANLIAGGIGMASSEGESKYFHQMNLIWGAANLLIAVPTYLSLRKRGSDLSLAETMKAQSAIEKTFLFNTGLDLLYITAGAYCLEKANNDSKRDLYKGYGKSLVLQGSGLLVFDVFMSMIHIHHGKNLYKLLSALQISGNRAAVILKM